MPAPNFPNRTLAIMDNLAFLRATDNESIDLIAIDPPFAANETFEGKVKPPITDAEISEERALAARHGPDALAKWEEYEGKPENQNSTRVKDDWFFRNVEKDWMNELRGVGESVRNWDRRIEGGEKPPTEEAPTARDRTLASIGEVVEAVRAVATENEAAYIALMSVRLLECHRVLKPTGSIYLHCDHHANSYLRMLMDAIFGHTNFRNQIAWCYTGPSAAKRWFPRKYDTILFYAKSPRHRFNGDAVRLPYVAEFTPARGVHGAGRGSGSEERHQRGRIPTDWWNDGHMSNISGWRDELTGYKTQKPLALYQRIIRASSNPGDTVLDLFAGCATTAIAAELEGRNWLACDMAYRASTMMMRRFYQNDIVLSGMNFDVVREALGAHNGKLESKDGKSLFKRKTGEVIGPPDLRRFPRKTTDPDDGTPVLVAPKRAVASSWNGSIPKSEAKAILLREHGCVCWGCGKRPVLPNGAEDPDELEVDHLFARKPDDGDEGGADDLYNLGLVCRKCNGRKGNRLTMEELRLDRERAGLLWKERKDLVHLGRALQTALEWQRRYGKQGSPAT